VCRIPANRDTVVKLSVFCSIARWVTAGCHAKQFFFKETWFEVRPAGFADNKRRGPGFDGATTNQFEESVNRVVDVKDKSAGPRLNTSADDNGTQTPEHERMFRRACCP